MRIALVVGIICIVFGVVALAYGGFTYTTRERVVEVGPIEVTTKEKRTFPISPVGGAALLAGGIVLVVLGARGRRIPA